jgi:hypothetical protein
MIKQKLTKAQKAAVLIMSIALNKRIDTLAVYLPMLMVKN